MKYYQEVTDWGDEKVPNHIYYLNDDKTRMVGYIQVGTKALFKFKKPIAISVKGRKFELLKMPAEADEVYFPKAEALVAPKQAIEFEGSNGKKYFVSKIGNKYTCTCPGFMFRHACKHVAEVSK